MKYKTRRRLQCFIADTILIIVLMLFAGMLTGCARKSAVISNTAEAAKETINVAVQQKPECADIGELANRQIAIVEDNCQLVMAKEKKNEWNDGLRVGILGTIFVLFGLGFILQRFDK
mgnify:CR=1 FL=1